MYFTVLENYDSNIARKRTFSILEVITTGAVPDFNNHGRMLQVCRSVKDSGYAFTKHYSELFKTYEEAEVELKKLEEQELKKELNK